MRLPRKLILLGYRDGPHTPPGWPAPADFVAHVHRVTAALEAAEIDEDWWRHFGGATAL
ncbi:hypothetical protein [Buchananella hordeovulneris]|uniref:hypothetical protein n=1 Tax=Buchananella hordeovulneris TaxID=52770 RepID=UPI00163AABF0|nr:hypothetical protein [Buchananella hordeovulneris]